MNGFQWCHLGMAAIILASLNPPAMAEPGSSAPQPKKLSEFDRPATTVNDWIAQANSTAIRVTGVRLEQRDRGLEVLLESAGRSDGSPMMRTEGNRLITDIDNAVLALPNGKVFQADNPTVDVSSVTVEQLNATTVRVTVVGMKTLPIATVQVSQTTAQKSSPQGAEEDDEENYSDGAEKAWIPRTQCHYSHQNRYTYSRYSCQYSGHSSRSHSRSGRCKYQRNP